MKFSREAFTYERGWHNKCRVIFIIDPNPEKRIFNLKTLQGARWSGSRKLWHVPDNRHYRQLFGIPEAYISSVHLAEVDTINRPALLKFTEELKLKAYSPGSIHTCVSEFVQLLKVLGKHPVNDLTQERLRAYFTRCLEKLRLSENTLHLQEK